MNQKTEQLYQAMLLDMEYCRGKRLEKIIELECLFNTCNRYWAILKNEAANYSFDNKTEEILFFKIIKPKFMAERLFYGLMSHALLFRESTRDPAALEKFWRQESLRLEKFRTARQSFYDYYTSGATDKDEEWFTRINSGAGKDLDERIITMQDQQPSSHLSI